MAKAIKSKTRRAMEVLVKNLQADGILCPGDCFTVEWHIWKDMRNLSEHQNLEFRIPR